jgi:acylphosphatase
MLDREVPCWVLRNYISRGTNHMTSSKASVETIARRVLVSGRVQGVGYRYGLAELARSLNITGWCRNLPDGRVEALIQGSKNAIHELLDWIDHGPPEAVIEHVDIEDQAILEPMLSESIQVFEIRR